MSNHKNALREAIKSVLDEKKAELADAKRLLDSAAEDIAEAQAEIANIEKAISTEQQK